jgi:hypothetical protein
MTMNEGTEADSQDARIKDLGDWRGERLALIRSLIKQADPEVVEELKWRKPSNAMSGTPPTWSAGRTSVRPQPVHEAALGVFASSGSGRRAAPSRNGGGCAGRTGRPEPSGPRPSSPSVGHGNDGGGMQSSHCVTVILTRRKCFATISVGRNTQAGIKHQNQALTGTKRCSGMSMNRLPSQIIKPKMNAAHENARYHAESASHCRFQR